MNHQNKDNSWYPGKPLFDRKTITDSGCWEWVGKRTPKGYGQLYVRGKMLYAHRVAWAQANGQTIPAGRYVMHKCDNPPCINPAHLMVGTALENHRDMVAKGRQRLGNPRLLLDTDRIRDLYESGKTIQQVATELGVSSAPVRKWMIANEIHRRHGATAAPRTHRRTPGDSVCRVCGQRGHYAKRHDAR